MSRNALFTNVAVGRPRRTAFDLSHERKFSLNMGDLVPILCQEVVPGDKIRLNTEVFMRFSPLISPVMHRINVYTHFFFVPNRLVFDGWQDFITGGVDGLDDTVFPTWKANMVNGLDASLLENGQLADFLGVPRLIDDNGLTSGEPISQLPFRAYQLIYNEYYRDQNLMPDLEIDKGNGIIATDELKKILTLRQRCWEHDYFTSALPWAQRGADVMMPGGTVNIPSMDVHSRGTVQLKYPNLPSATDNPRWQYINHVLPDPIYPNLGANSSDETRMYDAQNADDPYILSGADATTLVPGTGTAIPANALAYNPMNTLWAEVDGTTNPAEVQFQTTTINELRRAVRLQEWLEKNARAGSRYIEQIYSHFHVRSSDSRLQRPEYLGGGKTKVQISEVLQTSETQDSPQGNMAGHGIAVGNSHRFKRFFEEHGFVIGIMSVLPRTAYQQGLPRQFSKFDRFDYAWPEFANLGEQPILEKELYLTPTSSATDNDVFGYIPRYAEYKYLPSSVHGEFKDTLAYWHMGRIFDGVPRLNASFVTSNPRTDIFAVTDDSSDKLYCHIYNNMQAIRPLPFFGTPTL